MRVGLLTAWTNRANGGVFEAVVAHARMLAEQGFEPHVFSLAHPDDPQDASRLDGIEVTRVPVIGPRIIGLGKGLTRKLIEADLDVLHLHGIWTHVSADGAAWARKTGRPYVISTHGMCGRWLVSRGKLKKAVAKAWFEQRSWNSATVFHALTQGEAEDIAAVTERHDFAIIPNGIPIREQAAEPADPPKMLCIALICERKNLVALVDAWRLARGGERGWQLVLAGWGAEEDLGKLKAALGDNPEADGISFIGPVFGEAKDRVLGEASFVVLPSLHEGLPMGILEGWAAGVPSLMSDVILLPEGTDAGAAITMGTAPKEIAKGLDAAFSLAPAERQAMAEAARALAIRQFSIESIVGKWCDLYRSLAGRSA